jgi:hypothetical protein
MNADCMSAFFHHSPFTGANDEKSGFVLAVPRVANAPAFLTGATIGRPAGALFWRLREGLDSPEARKSIGDHPWRYFGFRHSDLFRISAVGFRICAGQ